jgi:hypothetical protein
MAHHDRAWPPAGQHLGTWPSYRDTEKHVSSRRFGNSRTSGVGPWGV